MLSLYTYWQNLLAQASLAQNEVAEQSWQTILEAYTAQGRHYHTSEHLEELFALRQTYAAEWHDTVIVDFTIFYHDIIYNTLRPAANERRSAALAGKHLQQLGLTETVQNDVAALIKDTKAHTIVHAIAVPDAPLLLDLDLAIFAAPRDRYARYMQQIRREYGHIPTRFYRKGRIRALRSFYRRPTIYHTAICQEAFEDAARRNIELELAYLGQ